MARIDAGALLDQVLETGTTRIDAIRSLLASNVTEGLHLDYKSGLLTEDRATPLELRKDVSAFANSDGGLLILGVAEPPPAQGDPAASGPRSIDGCRPPAGGKPLAEWARSCITPIAARFLDPPRYVEIDSPDGKVLVIAIPANPALIPVIIASRETYWLRHHDESIQAPDYLVAHLLIGRRRQLRLNLTVDNVIPSDGPHADPHLATPQFAFSVRVDNDAPTWIEDLSCGIVFYSSGTGPGEPMSDHVRSLIDVLPVDRGRLPTPFELGLCRVEFTLSRRDGVHASLRPFQSLRSDPFRKPMRFPYGVGTYQIEAALYLVPKGADAVWWQVTAEVNAMSLLLQ